jgi:hypothetical protein
LLGNKWIGSDSGKAIAAALQRNTTLASIDLSCMLCECVFCALTACDVVTKIGVEGSRSIAAALASNTTLKWINLSGTCGESLIVRRLPLLC